MFNEELKDRFSKEYSDSISMRKACYRAFTALEKYETEWGADLCTQPVEVVQKVIDELTGLRSKSINSRFSIYKEYVKWCIKNNIPGACDGTLMVDVSGIEKMRKHTVKNPRHLQRYLDEICDKESDFTTDNTMRCYHWLAYSGMNEEEILLVSKNHIDFQKMSIVFNNNEYPIYREAVPCIVNCINLVQFRFKHPNYSADKDVFRNRVSGDLLMRGIRGTPSLASIRTELSRRSRKCIEDGRTSMQLSYRRIWLSGLFYRMYEDELAGFEPDFYSIVLKENKGKKYKLDSGRNTIEAIYRKLAKDYLNDYLRWKMTL